MITHLRVSFLPVTPWVSNVVKSEKGYVIGGVLSGILNILADSMNFTFDLSIPPDRNYGLLLKNGTWNGFIGMLLRNIWPFLFPSVVPMIILSTFSDLRETTARPFKVFETLLWIYLAAFFAEGSPHQLRTWQSQMLMALWLLTILILNTVFVGQFKAVITSERSDDAIQTVKQLADRENMLPIIPADSIYEELFRNFEQEEFRRVYAKALANRAECIPHSSKTSGVETYQKVKDGLGVLVYTAPIMKSYLGHFCSSFHGNRKFYFLEQTFYSYQHAFAVRYDFPKDYLAEINNRILWMKEAGLIERYMSDSLQDYHKCQALAAQPEVQDQATLSLKHLLPVFYYILAASVVLSLFLVAECVAKRVEDSRRKKSRRQHK